MTERRKGGKTSKKKISLERVVELASSFMVETVPGWFTLSLLDLFHAALTNLQQYIEKDEAGEAVKNPFLQLDYDVKPTTVSESERKTKVSLEEAVAIGEELIKEWPGISEHTVMRTVTKGVVVQLKPEDPKGGPQGGTLITPPDISEELDALSEEDRAVRVDKLAAGFELSDLEVEGENEESPHKLKFKVRIIFRILPLTVTPDGARGFYPVLIGMEFQKGKLSDLDKETRDEIWKKLFEGLKEIAAPYVKAWREKLAIPPEEISGKAPLSAKAELVPDRVHALSLETFKVSAGFVPMHRLAERNRGGMPLFQEERRQFFELRTPLSWAVGLALFSRTSEEAPGDWQEVTVADLQDRVYCLTERDALRHGQQREDILAEMVKLHTERNYYVRYDFEQFGRTWQRSVALGSDYAVPNLELVFKESKTGRRVMASDPSVRALAVPLEVKGRRKYTPSGEDIKALPKGQFILYSFRWRWNPSFADDLKAAPLLDRKNRVKRDNAGNVIRGGFNIRVAVRIFAALYKLREEREYTAYNLLILLAHDIYKPSKQSKAGRNVIEREADRLFDLLGLEEDPKHPDRREEVVARAVYRLKQSDIGALLPGTDERPRPPSERELASGRRKSPFYHLVRSQDFTPGAALVTREEAAELEAEADEELPALPPSVKRLEPDRQRPLPGLVVPTVSSIPSGDAIRAAREAAGVSLRDFARMMQGPSFKTWSMIETGQRSASVGRISGDVWKRVRDFISKYGKGAGKS